MPAAEHARSSSARSKAAKRPRKPAGEQMNFETAKSFADWEKRIRPYLKDWGYDRETIDLIVAWADREETLEACPHFDRKPFCGKHAKHIAEATLPHFEEAWSSLTWEKLRMVTPDFDALCEVAKDRQKAINEAAEHLAHLTSQRPHVGPLSLPEHDAAIERAYGRLRDAMEAAR